MISYSVNLSTTTVAHDITNVFSANSDCIGMQISLFASTYCKPEYTRVPPYRTPAY